MKNIIKENKNIVIIFIHIILQILLAMKIANLISVRKVLSIDILIYTSLSIINIINYSKNKPQISYLLV